MDDALPTAITLTEIPVDFIKAEESESVPPQATKKRKLSQERDETEQAQPPTPTSATPPTPSTPLTSAITSAITVRPPTFLPSPDGLPYFITSDVPMNRQGFRYIPAGPSPPGSMLSHRTIESPPGGYVRVSWEDRSPYLRVTTDGRGVMGDKGFRSARLNVPVKEGKWYMEVRMHRAGGEGQGQGAHVRLGWGRREAPLNGPAGMDGYSYAMRDKTGEKITLSRLKPYGRSWGSGDVIGLYISLPPRRQPEDPNDPARVLRKRIAINYKNQLYYESMDYAQSKEMIALMDYQNPSTAPSKKNATVKNANQSGSGGNNRATAGNRRRKSKPTPMPDVPLLRPLPTLPNSCIAFFINGECQGPAFTDVYDYLQLRPSAKQKSRKGVPAYVKERENMFDDGSLGYYPFISVFNDARIEINAGPDFDYPPPPDIDAFLASMALNTNIAPPNENPAKAEDLNPPVPPQASSSLATTDPLQPADRTWRPLCERYREYMQEEENQDEKEESDARRSYVANERLEAKADRAHKRSKSKSDKKSKKSRSQSHQSYKIKKSGLSEVTNASSLVDDVKEGEAVDEGLGEGQGYVAMNKAEHMDVDMDVHVVDSTVYAHPYPPAAIDADQRVSPEVARSPLDDRNSGTPSSARGGAGAEDDADQSDGAEGTENASDSGSSSAASDDDDEVTNTDGGRDDEETESNDEGDGPNQSTEVDRDDVEMDEREHIIVLPEGAQGGPAYPHVA